MSNALFIITMLCLSNSMGDTLGCGDKLYTEPVNITATDAGEWGALYVFEYENARIKHDAYVVHRLIYTYDNFAVFRGDNNNYMEIVDKSAIKYKVRYIKHQS